MVTSLSQKIADLRSNGRIPSLLSTYIGTPPMAHWRGRVDFLFVIIELFAISYVLDVISGNLSKSALFEGVGHFELKFRTEGASPTNHCWCQKTRVIAFRVVSKHPQYIVCFCHNFYCLCRCYLMFLVR